MSEGRGLPLLSGPPPSLPSNLAQSDGCRKCGKEFNLIFSRSRKCNHCGYLYCHSCSDYQALMPRSGNASGYDSLPVCGYCIEHLNITAAGKAQLKSLPLGKLKKYANAYSIRISHAVEKEDVIEAILLARRSDGCLPPEHENYYRRNSVPAADQRPGLRGIFRGQPATPSVPPPPPPRDSRPPIFPRPDLAPDLPPHHGVSPNYTQYPVPPPNLPPRPQPHPNPHFDAQPQDYYQQHQFYHPQQQPFPTPPQPHPTTDWRQYVGRQQQQQGFPGGFGPRYNAQTHSPPPPPPPQASRPLSSHQQRQGPPPPPQPPSTQPTLRPAPAAPPSLDALVNMTSETINKLSISSLKSILTTNHVHAGQVLEKGDLVKKVVALVDDERRERERQRQVLELEELERLQQEQDRRDEQERAQREAERGACDQQRLGEQQPAQEASLEDSVGSSDQQDEPFDVEKAPSSSSLPKADLPQSPPNPYIPERAGLCVVCQDEEANIAIVDCGHMAMCRGCSDLIMSSSRECPLCRTRIVTAARLLRIFKS